MRDAECYTAAMSTALTSHMVCELVASHAITSAEVDDIVARYLADPRPGAILLGSSYAVDIAQALAQPGWPKDVMARASADIEVRRSAVKAAVLLTRAERA